jgi:Abnormal spindle-like microcephaly-assoc'd, ASPM-SPD-2-Hydin
MRSARLTLRAAIALLATVPAAHAQFAFSVVSGSTVTPVTTVYSFGNVWSGDGDSVQFQITNTSNAAASLTVLAVAGEGFTLSGAPTLPVQLNPQGSVNFVVTFLATLTGGYSASLSADGISVFLTATVVPGLTYQVQTSAGNQNLGTSPVNFGSVAVGQTQTLQFLVSNGTTQALVVPSISVSQGDFSLSGPTPSGVTLQPAQVEGFEVQFQPSESGTRTGTLTIGASSYSLTGTGKGGAAPAPTPQVAITLAQTVSDQQGTVTVSFASPATAGGSGTLTLQFQPSVSGATDPAIAFASGGQSLSFTFAAGDVQATFGSQSSAAFQTGTTSGTITFTAQIGSSSSEQSVTIAPAAVGYTNAQGTISPSSVQVQVTGFDNTRSAGQLSFTFYDDNGNMIAPGAITANAGSAFAQYFATSAGGNFELTAVFPVTGDTTVITYFQASITNSEGTSATARTSIQ